jgi:hypothetical protein
MLTTKQIAEKTITDFNQTYLEADKQEVYNAMRLYAEQFNNKSKKKSMKYKKIFIPTKEEENSFLVLWEGEFEGYVKPLENVHIFTEDELKRILRDFHDTTYFNRKPLNENINEFLKPKL